MKEKILKARKDHKCERCDGIIRKGNLYKCVSGKNPRYADDNETQIGIEYFTYRVCISDVCDGMLKYVDDPKKYLKECLKGKHEFVQSYEFDHYVDSHRVCVPTDEYFCSSCGETRKQ